MRLIGLFIMIICSSLFIFPLDASAAEVIVNPGESIQDAVKRSVSGDTIRVMPGLYEETVYIDKDSELAKESEIVLEIPQV